MAQHPADHARPHKPARYPRVTIRMRYGRKMLHHGLALGWRAEWDGEPFPVEVRKIQIGRASCRARV